MEEALRILGYSVHTESPRFGNQAQIARWGLKEDKFPEDLLWVKELWQLNH